MPCLDNSIRTRLMEGVVIPAHPLALDASRRLDERRQRGLSRYYAASGAGGLAVGVHTTQFAIRDPKVTENVKFIAGAPAVRSKLVDLQRQFSDTHPIFVTEGRDQGTVAFPQAQVKIFLTADPVERAKRRLAELQAKGLDQDLDTLTQAVIDRDRSDEQRETGPLKAALDARHVDTTGLTLDQVVQVILDHVREICPTLIPSEPS